MNPSVSFVIPCLNEEATLQRVIQSCHQAGTIIGSYEIIVADNGSTDQSPLIAIQNDARLVRVSQRGYGSALRAGFSASTGDFIVMGDADFTYDFLDSVAFIRSLQRTRHQLLIGNRFAGGIEKASMPLLHKYLGNPVLSLIGRILFNIKVSDFHCGLRAFDRQAILDLNLVSDRMEFASEMIIRSALSGYSISELPTALRAGPPHRKPHLRTWQDGWRHLKFMLSFSPKYSYFPICLLMLGIAIILFAFFMFRIDPFAGSNTLLYSALFYAYSLWSFSEYVICRVILKTKVLYPNTLLSSFLYKASTSPTFVDKAAQALSVNTILILILVLYSLFSYSGDASFVSSFRGILTNYLILCFFSTSFFLYIFTTKMSTYQRIASDQP